MNEWLREEVKDLKLRLEKLETRPVETFVQELTKELRKDVMEAERRADGEKWRYHERAFWQHEAAKKREMIEIIEKFYRNEYRSTTDLDQR